MRHNTREASDEMQMIFGIRAVTEAIDSGKEIDRLFVQEGLQNATFNELRKVCRDHEVHFTMVPIYKLNKIAPGKNHQGVVAYLSAVTYHKIETLLPSIFESGKLPFVLILDRITDVRNFGAIARSAECSGVDAIIIPSRGAAQVNGDAIKTSAGALHKIPVCKEDNLKTTIEFLKNSGLTIASCTEKGSVPYYTAPLSGPLAVIMGSEEDGISGEYLKKSDVRVLVPMKGTISSLNVSVATGIILFEVLRQRELSAK
ncbi:MAG TPA: 23S rRNA (guanosine(2251)-2'-O)-methyltransferase RlmB [Bacteroidia bacterium]|nr:23S rRNA (guanosine(2251)-2'-O)-methyltransferase RlmB [Bacteroidia bacterium]